MHTPSRFDFEFKINHEVLCHFNLDKWRHDDREHDLFMSLFNINDPLEILSLISAINLIVKDANAIMRERVSFKFENRKLIYHNCFDRQLLKDLFKCNIIIISAKFLGCLIHETGKKRNLHNT